MRCVLSAILAAPVVNLASKEYHLSSANAMSAAASQMAAQMAQMNPGGAGGNVFQPGQDPAKVFQSEAENLEVLEHWSVLDGIEGRMLASK